VNCRKVTHLLSAYMDGELPGVESLQIRGHLNACSECAAEYDDLLSMKRLVGRLKIQEPTGEIAAKILQSIRIETDLRAEQSPAARFFQFTASIRGALAMPRALGLGFGVAAVAALLYSQSISGNQVHVVGEWDHSVPPASEFTSGVRYPSSSRFISPAYGSGSSGNGIETVSFGSSLQEFRQSPSQFGANNGFFIRSH
jgi:anti-sigma factor RsiW